MSYNTAVYDKLRSLKVPHALALSLADDESPLAIKPEAETDES